MRRCGFNRRANRDFPGSYDVTDKNTTNIISRTGYEGSAFTHQGWVLDKEWQEYLVLDDEYDGGSAHLP